MDNPQITWIVTFGMIAFWVLAPLIDLIRTPKTTSISDGSDRTARTDRSPPRAAYQ